MLETTVVVIGCGATGIGALRDLSMRGIPAILLEQGGIAHGTSSRFHGLLHSGARYVVNDNESARECIEENMIVRRIGRQCVEETEGFFALTPQDDPAYVEKFIEGCRTAGIGCIDCKKILLKHLRAALDPIRERADAIRGRRGYVLDALDQGARRCREIAAGTIAETRAAMGIVPRR